jgi:hypothetical protein
MNQLKRRFHVHVVVEGDTWESAGAAMAAVAMILELGDPKSLAGKETRPQFVAKEQASNGGYVVEITEDPSMTPERYQELLAEAKKGVPEP